MRLIFGFLITIGLLAGCVDTETTSQVASNLCTAEDQQADSCPDSVWRIPYTRQYAHDAEVGAGLPTPTAAVKCDYIAGSVECKAKDYTNLENTQWVQTTCVFMLNGSQVYCVSHYCTSFDQFPYTSPTIDCVVL